MFLEDLNGCLCVLFVVLFLYLHTSFSCVPLFRKIDKYAQGRSKPTGGRTLSNFGGPSHFGPPSNRCHQIASPPSKTHRISDTIKFSICGVIFFPRFGIFKISFAPCQLAEGSLRVRSEFQAPNLDMEAAFKDLAGGALLRPSESTPRIFYFKLYDLVGRCQILFFGLMPLAERGGKDCQILCFFALGLVGEGAPPDPNFCSFSEAAILLSCTYYQDN